MYIVISRSTPQHSICSQTQPPRLFAAIGFAPDINSLSTVILPTFCPIPETISAPSFAREDSTLFGTSPPFSVSTSFSSVSDHDVIL